MCGREIADAPHRSALLGCGVGVLEDSCALAARMCAPDVLREGRPIAKISKQFSWIGRDQYVVDIMPGEDDCLILALTVVIDMMVSKGR